MKFEFGQKILCVNDHFSYCRYPIRKGSIYTIRGFYQCACGSHQVTLVEIPFVANMSCRCYRTSIRRQSYYNWRFVPLEYYEMINGLSSDINEDFYEINVQNAETQILNLKILLC